jgi:invasion protein IalB
LEAGHPAKNHSKTGEGTMTVPRRAAAQSHVRTAMTAQKIFAAVFSAGCGRVPVLHATHFRMRGLALLAGIVLGTAVAPSCVFAQGAVRSVHGDWQIRCETPPGAQNEQCALFQSVVAEDRANVGITVLVLKTADQKSRLMRVQAPLGVLLPAGLGLKVDNQDVGRAGFVRCLPRGCYAEVVMDDALVGKFRTGQTATFFIFQTPEEGIGFPLGLKGFGEGYDKLP